MSIRSFNYTGRRKITTEEASVQLRQLNNKTLIFDADIQLAKKHSFPDGAAICVEAYRGSSASWMRFPFGTVGAVQPPDDRRLTDFDGPEGVLFRIKVTLPENGRILAEADALSPRAPDEEDPARQPLLSVRSDNNLGKRVWRLDFVDRPTLLVNNALGDWRDIVRDKAFIALVMPSILEALLIRIVVVDKHRSGDQDDDTGDWRSQWLRFVRSIPGTVDQPDVDDLDSVEQWIDDTVEAFSRKQRILDRFDEYWNRSDK